MTDTISEQKIRDLLSSSSDPTSMLDSMLKLTRTALDVDAILVYTWDPHFRHLKFSRGSGETNEISDPLLAILNPLLDSMINEERSKKIENSTIDLREDQIENIDMNSVTIYPILRDDSLGGATVFCESDGGFDTDDRKQIEKISPYLLLIAENKTFLDTYRSFEERVNTDDLTNLYNRNHFEDRMTAEMIRARRMDHPLSLLMMDIDRFKNCNDRFGHQYGDYVLQEISDCIRETIREYDIPSRYGGEEFAIILPNCKQSNATSMAERLRKKIESFDFRSPDKQETVSITVSIGIASYPVNANMKSDLVEKADQALYLAKSEGRNRVCRSLVVSEELIRVAYVPPAFTSPYYKDILEGVRDVTQEISNVELISRAPEHENDHEQMKSILQELLEDQKIDALAICTKSTEVVDHINQFPEADIPVFLFNLPEMLEGVNSQCLINYDQKEAGAKIGTYLARLLRNRGNIALLQGLPERSSQLRSEGFEKVLSNYPNLNLVAKKEADWLRDKAHDITLELLETYPELDAIFAVSDEMALGAMEAVKEQDRKGEIFVVGLDGTQKAVQSIKQGELSATLNTNPRAMGQILLRTIVRSLIKGEDVEWEISSPINMIDPVNVDDVDKLTSSS